MNYDIKVFVGMIVVSLLAAVIAAGIDGDDLTDQELIDMGVLNIRALEHSEYNRHPGDIETEIHSGILVNYFIKVNGSPTYTYSVYQRRGELEAVYNMDGTVGDINIAKTNAIRQHAFDRWEFVMSKNNVWIKPYVKGS